MCFPCSDFRKHLIITGLSKCWPTGLCNGWFAINFLHADLFFIYLDFNDHSHCVERTSVTGIIVEATNAVAVEF